MAAAAWRGLAVVPLGVGRRCDAASKVACARGPATMLVVEGPNGSKATMG